MVKTLEVRALRSEAEDLFRRAKNFEIDTIAYSTELTTNCGKKLRLLLDDYNWWVSKFRECFEKIVSINILPSQHYLPAVRVEKIDSEHLLEQIMSECKKAIIMCDEFLSKTISLSAKEKEELKVIKKDIEKMIEPILPVCVMDLHKSLEEFNSGHYLASALICGRIIDVTINKLKKALGVSGIDEILSELNKMKVIEKGTEERVTRAIKQWRNIYSHQLGTYPDVTTSLIILAGTINLLKSIVKSKLYEKLELR